MIDKSCAYWRGTAWWSESCRHRKWSREAWKEFLDPGFVLTQTWLLWPFRESSSRWKISLASPCHSSLQRNKSINILYQVNKYQTSHCYSTTCERHQQCEGMWLLSQQESTGCSWSGWDGISTHFKWRGLRICLKSHNYKEPELKLKDVTLH